MNLQILVVEDDTGIREVLTLQLQTLGHTVLAVESGEEALDILAKSKLDLVLTDRNLGEYKMNGCELLIKAKAMYPTVHFVLMTAFYDVKNAVETMKNGAIDYLCKPFTFSDLEAILQKVIFEKNNLKSLESIEKEHIIRVLSDNLTYEQAAKVLGINMATLWRKRKSYSINADHH